MIHYWAMGMLESAEALSPRVLIDRNEMFEFRATGRSVSMFSVD